MALRSSVYPGDMKTRCVQQSFPLCYALKRKESWVSQLQWRCGTAHKDSVSVQREICYNLFNHLSVSCLPPDRKQPSVGFLLVDSSKQKVKRFCVSYLPQKAKFKQNIFDMINSLNLTGSQVV